ncbi:MAG TPA: TfpX/TfpZ family type IV pilin accessory protein [Dokdonella sp.]
MASVVQTPHVEDRALTPSSARAAAGGRWSRPITERRARGRLCVYFRAAFLSVLRMSRWKAAAVHLSISAGLGLIVAALLLLVWYPPPYGQVAGARKLVILLVGVDLVLGPLLTFVVFKPGKRGLKFDLAVIAILQAAAFVYGLSVVLENRPVFLVAVVDHFVLVTAGEIAPADLAQGSREEFRRLPWTGARLVGAVMPTAVEERNRLVFEALAGKDLQNLPRTFVEYAAVARSFLAQAKPLERLRRTYPVAAAAAEQWARSQKRDTESLLWAPVVARNGELAMLLDRESGQPLKPLAITTE